MLAQLEALHPDDLRVIFRHFPLLSIHDKASLAGQASEAAGAQGKFWPMYDILFERWDEWVDLSPDAFRGWLSIAAIELDLDIDKFNDDLALGRYSALMEEAFTAALSSGLTGTPAIFLNDELFPLAPELPVLEAFVRLEIHENRQFAAYPPMKLSAGSDLIVRLHLNIGEIVIQLYPDSAPLAVNSFLFLQNEGWFDGNGFIRVIEDVLAETGDPSGTGFGDPGYHYQLEIDPRLDFGEVGMVAITNSGSDSNGSKFFITLRPLPELDGQHTIFGRVIDGLELLSSLEKRDPLDDILEPPQAFIKTVSVESR